MIQLLIATALAGAPVISAAGGYDVPTDQPWTGLDFALQPTKSAGFEPVARVSPGWAFGDRSLVVFGEIGLMVHIPEEEALLRGGIVLRPTLLTGAFRTPMRLGPGAGLVPAVFAQVEFEWTPKAPLTLGFRGGPASTVSDYACDQDHLDPATCLTWHAGFGGGLYLRKRFADGLAFEAMVGPTASITLGYAL